MQRDRSLFASSTWAALAVLVLTVCGCSGVVDLVEAPAEGKDLVCHKGRTIEVAEAAVAAHLDHGDSRGPCR